MEFQEIHFEKSSAKLSQCPTHSLPEYAFIGRSNVGKSTLINILTQTRHLAKVSSTPGKTQLINHFKINHTWYLVDLPGYGYTKLPPAQNKRISAMISEYLYGRKQIACLFLLIDIRHPNLSIDLEMMKLVNDAKLPIAIVLTKKDKLKRSKLGSQIQAHKKSLLTLWQELPPIFITSSSEKDSPLPIVEYIDTCNENIKGRTATQ